MIYFVLISAASLAILALLIWRAPRGWQDENGFHLGQEPFRSVDAVAADKGAIETERFNPSHARAKARKAA